MEEAETSGDLPALELSDVRTFQLEAVRRMSCVLDAASAISRMGPHASEDDWDRLRRSLAAAPARLAQVLQISLRDDPQSEAAAMKALLARQQAA